MKRFILTGAPGAGKTVLLRALEQQGHGVVEEAATDVIAVEQACGIAEPWKHPGFLDSIVTLQNQRLARAAQAADEVQFHDRSVLCTLALARYLDIPPPSSLHSVIDRILRERTFELTVFFIRGLGFVAPTAARRITFEESLRFERIHEQVYREHGFHLAHIEPAPVPDRVARILRIIEK